MWNNLLGEEKTFSGYSIVHHRRIRSVQKTNFWYMTGPMVRVLDAMENGVSETMRVRWHTPASVDIVVLWPMVRIVTDNEYPIFISR